MNEGTKVVLSSRAKKDLKRIPQHIVDKLDAWIEAVETDGIAKLRRLPGYHDEPLRGDRLGQHSIRLSKAYRAFYEVKRDGRIEFLEVKEVNKHEY